ncbi:MAG: serine acetyltransferase [Rhodocyclaceae bacterium]|nr:MAG: serine acetyltransferase [Rhodocyclaceae bacterium]
MTAGVQPPCRFALLRRDLQRYFQAEGDGYPGLLKALRIFLDTPGMQAVVVFRFCSWVERSVRLRLLRYPLKVIAYVLQKLCIILWGISIDDRAQIGGGLYIGHFGGIIIGPVKMGRDCSVARNVAIGRRAGSGASGVPTIGDRVWIGAGSLLFDGITVGDGVTIGPLTVVGRNLPSRVLVMGNPMRLLRKNYDNSAEVYGKAGPPAE